jgi:hypothetical protein
LKNKEGKDLKKKRLMRAKKNYTFVQFYHIHGTDLDQEVKEFVNG